MIAYKLVRKLKDGKLHPLFINKKSVIELGIWLQAECYPTKGFAVRKGWHCCFRPYAPHLKTNLSSGEQRVWVECEVEDFKTYDRPESQGGQWILSQKIKVIREMSMTEVNETLRNVA